MNKVLELNLNNIKRDSDFLANNKLNKKSPIVEVFSSIAKGENLNKYGKKADVAMSQIKNLATQSMQGNSSAIAELNTIQKFVVEPELAKMVQLFSFMGTFKDIDYMTQPMVKTYKHEGIRSNSQASQGDVPFAVTSWEEYPISTQTVSSGYAVNYREIASGNLDKVSEGMEQVKVDMMNRATYHVIMTMYQRIKETKGIKYFNESQGLTKKALDDLLKKIRGFGKTSILGDYSMVSQINPFQGYKEHISENVMELIRQTGLSGAYNGSPIVELPNQYNLSKVNEKGDNFVKYLPEGLLFLVPQGEVSPLQIFRKGGLTSMSGDDITTGTQMIRFDMEIGADVAKGQEYKIGMIRDTNFDKDLLG